MLNEKQLLPRVLLKYEVHITEHCNLNCRGCFHCSSIATPEFLSIKEYEEDCARLSHLFMGDMETIELLGGEPLLHAEIVEFFRITRCYFPTGRIILVTNGILLPNMKEEFWVSAREYKIEIAPTKYPINVDYDAIRKKAERYGITYYNFAMTTDKEGNKVLENYHFDVEGKQDPVDNFYKCYRGNLCITLSHGRLYTCALCAHLHHLKEYFKIDSIHLSDRNSINIYEAKSAEEISLFLTKPIPACRYCKLDENKKYVPFQLTKKQLEEWL